MYNQIQKGFPDCSLLIVKELLCQVLTRSALQANTHSWNCCLLS